MKKLVSVLMLMMLLVLMPCTSLAADSPLEGKTLSVLGASISTYAGASNGAAADTTNSTIRNNVKYYPNTTIPEVTLNDTWWTQVANDLGLRLLVNNAWSGSAILLERSGTVGAYVDRCVQLHDNTGANAGEEPDIICIQMGFNDFSYGKSTLGTADIDYAALIKANGYGTPTTTMEATAIMLDKIVKRYPDAEVYMFNHFKRIGQSAADTALMEQLNAAIETVCSRFGVEVVDLYTTMTDPDHIGDGRLHPNRLGMDTISEAVKTAILNRNPAQRAHTVSLDLDGVTADYIDTRLVLDGDKFTVNLTAPAGDKLSVTVTMGGKNITASAYANGKVTVSAVTDDVTVTAKAVHTPAQYRWEFNGTDLASVGGTANALTKTAGTTANGVFSKTRYSLAKSVVLEHDQPWVVEWKCKGTFQNANGSSGARMFTSDAVNANYNARYIFKSNTNGIIAMGEKDTAGSQNYGIALKDHGIDWTALHTYRLENRIAADGSNMVWLFVDGKQIGPMNHYYVGTTDKKTTSNWLSGKDFVFPYMGTDSHGFTNASIEYVQVWEAHVHSYVSTVTAPTCTAQGYTTHTCTICGYSYTDSKTAAKGHTYSGTNCKTCGAERPSELNLNGLNVLCLGDSITAGQGLTTDTRWTNVMASKYDWNLTNKSQGGISLSSYYYTANGETDVSIAKKAEILKTMTVKPDVIIVWGGHNDTSYRASPLGTWEDETTDSFKGALKYIAELAEEYAPDATLFVLTPLWNSENPSALKVPENTTDTNWMFVDAIYEGAEKYGWIPVNMDLCGITPFTKSGLLLDNIHPNDAGTESIVAYLSEELARCGENSKKDTIIFNESAVSMGIGESTTLKGELSPRSGTGTTKFTWSSSNSSVATVEANGKLTAIASGTATVTATAANGVSADIRVSVACSHTYKSTTTAPTCTTQGYTTHTCTLCGHSYVDSKVAAKGHTAVAVPGKAATCTAPGLTDGAKCATCGVTTKAQETIAAKGHTEVKVTGKAATCTATGLTDGAKCSVCGVVTKTQQTIPAKGHTNVTVPGKAATCTAAGLTDGAKCSVCGVVTKTQQTIPAKGHTTVTVPGKAATCTATGLTDGTKCSVCGVVTKAQQTIAAKGHTNVTVPGKAATCTATGLTDGAKCSVCGVVTKTQQTIAAKGHTNVTVPGKAATCTATGLTDGAKCSVCGAVTKTQQTIAAKGHTEVKVPGKAATCTATGLTDGAKCSVCGVVTKTQQTIPAKGHTNVTVPGKAATCTASGLTDGAKCSVCGVVTKVQQTIPAKGHTNVTVPGKAATCTDPGLTDGAKCSVCGVVTKKQETIAALGHSWSEWKQTKAPTEDAEGEKTRTCSRCKAAETESIPKLNHTHSYTSTVTAPTCTEKGYTTHTCKCGHSYVDTYVNAKGHTAVTVSGKAATCTATGLTDGTKCSVCSIVTKKQETIAALGHSWGEWKQTKAPTEDAEGEKTRTCSRCKTTETESIPKLSHTHSYTSTVTAPTCTEKGYTTHTCKCGHSYVDAYVNAKGHTAVTVPGKAATCTATGLTDGAKCSVCGTVTKKQETIAAKGHTNVTVPGKAATCTATGLTDGAKCSVCGVVTKTQETIAAKGHTNVTVPGKAATCTAPGLTDGAKCSVCGVVTKKQETIAAKGHTNVTVPGKAATCTATGLTDGAKCSVCGVVTKKQETIAAKGHTAVTVPGKAATCTATGLTDGAKCSVCGTVTKKQQTIAAKGHTEAKIPGKAATCTAIGLTDGAKCSVCGIVTKKQETIAAKGHTEVKVTGKAATCTAAGLTDGAKCSVCGTITKKQETIAAKGHTEVQVPGKAATCTATGLTDGTKCSVCGIVTKDQQVIEAKSHTEVILPGKEPTETATGLTEGKKCSVCGTITVPQQTIPVKEHVHRYDFVVIDGLLYESCSCGDKSLAVRVARDGKTVTVTLLKELFPTTVYAARYDTGGRMLEVRFAQVDGTEISFAFTSEEGDFRVFFLTTDFVPWLNAVSPTKK